MDQKTVQHVNAFTDWLKPFWDDMSKPADMYKYAHADYANVMYEMRSEKNRLANNQMKRMARKRSGKWARHN